MAGFTSNDHLITNISNSGKYFSAPFAKQFNPNAAAVANEWHLLSRGGGNPQADTIFDVGTAQLFQSVCDLTTGAGCIPHGGNVGINGDDFKTLLSMYAVTAAATVVPATLLVVDILGFYRVSAMTAITSLATSGGCDFTANAGTDLLTYTLDWQNYTKVRFTTSGTLPSGLALATDYWLVRQSATTSKVATTFSNARDNVTVDILDAGTGTHTLTCRLPRYSDGAGVQACAFVSSGGALGAGTPQMTLVYTNASGVTNRATPTNPSPPVGKTGATCGHIPYTGATGVGKFGPSYPLQATDTGIRSIESIKHNASYVSGIYTVALFTIIAEIPLQVLGQATFMDFTQAMYPSFPRVYDGACLHLMLKSGVATPANSLIDGRMNFGWS